MCISDNFGMQLVTNENERPILEEHNMLQIEDWRAYPVLSQLGLWARQEHSALIQEPTGKRKKTARTGHMQEMQVKKRK